MNALILSAGFGTRLYPLTRDTPKALIKVNGKPLIEHIIEKIGEVRGMESIYILSNNRFYTEFLEWMDDYKRKSESRIKLLNNGVNYEYEKKGAVSDIKFSLNFIKESDLFLIASDNLFEFDLNKLINISDKENASSTLLKKAENKELIKKYNNIFLDKNNKIVFYEEKPEEPRSNIFSTACYFLKKQDTEKIKNHNFQNSDNFGEIISFLHKESEIYGHLTDKFWCDIGSLEELEKAKEYFKNKHP